MEKRTWRIYSKITCNDIHVLHWLQFKLGGMETKEGFIVMVCYNKHVRGSKVIMETLHKGA